MSPRGLLGASETDGLRQARTTKYLCGVATGCWIVRLDWVEASVAACACVPEAPYELTDPFGGGTGDTPHAPRCARLAAVRTSVPQLYSQGQPNADV